MQHKLIETAVNMGIVEEGTDLSSTPVSLDAYRKQREVAG